MRNAFKLSTNMPSIPIDLIDIDFTLHPLFMDYLIMKFILNTFCRCLICRGKFLLIKYVCNKHYKAINENELTFIAWIQR